MKRLGVLLLLLVTLPVFAQTTDALLLYTASEDSTDIVRVLNVDTGEVTQIAELQDVLGHSWGDVGWSPDGGYVWVVDTPSEAHRRLRLYEVGSWSESTITDDLFLFTCDPSLYWSPDGHKMAYFTGEESDSQLALLNLADNVAQTYDVDNSLAQGANPIWSPDGRYIVIDHQLVDASDGSVVTTFDGIFREFSPDSHFLTYWNQSVRLYDLANDESLDLVVAADTSGAWSPDGRYLFIRLSDEEAAQPYQFYDTQTHQLQPFSLHERIWGIRGWLQGGAEALVVTYAKDDGSNQAVLRYEMATGNITPLLETPGFVMRVVTDGSWLVVTYNVSEERGYQPSTRTWMSDGERVLDEELVIYGSVYSKAQPVAWSPDGRWLTLWAADGIYRFDPQTAVLERLPVEGSRFDVPMWSPDSRYLVFHVFPDANSQSRQTMVWDTVADTIVSLPLPVGTLIGWQKGDTQDSLLYCGIGG